MAEQAQGVPPPPTPPIVACLRCRVQKLKCDRELPSCERCRKQDAPCTYPAPPDRKKIAAEKNKRATASQSDRPNFEYGPDSSSAETNANKKQRLSHDAMVPFRCLAEPDFADLPSTEIGLLLGEVYFKRIYNAHLMYHKTVGFQVYMLNKTPDYLQRAKFAHAALFLQEVEPQYQKYVRVFSMQTLHDRAWSWAHAASVQVLSHVDEPSVLKIQALQVLQQFYWARGEIVRAKVHASLAYRLSQLLGYDKLYETEDSSLANPSLKFDREIRRRSFWASWATLCLHSEEIPRIQESAADLTLPAKFAPRGSIQGVDLTHGQRMDRAWKTCEDAPSHTGEEGRSLMAELMKLLGNWAKIRALILALPSAQTLKIFEEVQEIDESLNQLEFSTDFPVEELLAKARDCDESPEFLVCVCSVYYMIRIFAEAFKYRTIPPAISHAFGEMSDFQRSPEGRVAFALSLKFSQLLQQVLALGLDITRLWHVTGYTAFIVARVLLFFQADQQPNDLTTGTPRVPGLHLTELEPCRTVIEVLSIYWKPLKLLVVNLDASIEIARSGNISSGAMLTFPWDYANYLSDCEQSLSLSDQAQ